MATLSEWSQCAVRQRLQDAPYDWQDEQESTEAKWLTWAVARDAANLLGRLRLPNFVAFRDQMRASSPESDLSVPDFADDTERFFLKAALVLAARQLLRMPEYGPAWNAVQAQRLEVRAQAEWLEKHGQADAARKLLLEKMPKALRRSAIEARRKSREEEVTTPQATPPPIVPATQPPQEPETRGGIRP